MESAYKSIYIVIVHSLTSPRPQFDGLGIRRVGHFLSHPKCKKMLDARTHNSILYSECVNETHISKGCP